MASGEVGLRQPGHVTSILFDCVPAFKLHSLDQKLPLKHVIDEMPYIAKGRNYAETSVRQRHVMQETSDQTWACTVSWAWVNTWSASWIRRSRSRPVVVSRPWKSNVAIVIWAVATSKSSW